MNRTFSRAGSYPSIQAIALGIQTMTPSPSRQTSGKRPGKQIREDLGLWGSKRTRDAGRSSSEFTRSLEAAGYDSFGALPMPEVAARPLRLAFCCFPGFAERGGEAKTAPKDRL